MQTRCRCSTVGDNGHNNDYAETDSKLWRLLTDLKGTIKWKQYLGVFTYPIAIILKHVNGSYMRLKNCWLDNTQILNFVIEYLRKNPKVRETIFGCSYGVQVESLSKKISKILWHCPIKREKKNLNTKTIENYTQSQSQSIIFQLSFGSLHGNGFFSSHLSGTFWTNLRRCRIMEDGLCKLPL